jgi:hypothetical protein
VMMRIVLIFLLLCTPALAHDPSHPELNEWFNRLASDCGPWFCVSSKCCSPQFGALSSPESHPRAEADFIGSPATTSFRTELHLGHSNRRCSKPIGLGLMLASIMRIVQCEQRGRSMDVSDGPEEK